METIYGTFLPYHGYTFAHLIFQMPLGLNGLVVEASNYQESNNEDNSAKIRLYVSVNAPILAGIEVAPWVEMKHDQNFTTTTLTINRKLPFNTDDIIYIRTVYESKNGRNGRLSLMGDFF